MKLRVDANDAANMVHANFDLLSRTVSLAPIALGTFTAGSASVETLANGYAKYSLTLTSGTETVLRPIINCLNTNTSAINETYVGNASKGFDFFGAQLEQADFGSSYIPTTGASATRAADSTPFIGSAKAMLTGTVGTGQSVLIDVTLTDQTTGYARIIGTELSQSEMIAVAAGNNTRAFSFQSTNPGSGSLDATFGSGRSWTYSAGVKAAFGQASVGASLVGGGGTVVTDSAVHVIMETPNIGRGDNQHMYGQMRRLTIWNYRLTDATLQSLTTP